MEHLLEVRGIALGTPFLAGHHHGKVGNILGNKNEPDVVDVAEQLGDRGAVCSGPGIKSGAWQRTEKIHLNGVVAIPGVEQRIEKIRVLRVRHDTSSRKTNEGRTMSAASQSLRVAVLACSPVTVAELWHGARPREHKILQDLFEVIQCVPIDLEIGRRAGDYLRMFAKSHSVELEDALIAATASVHGLELWTRNRRHYPMKEVAFF